MASPNGAGAPAAAGAAALSAVDQDVVSALVNMGFKSAEAEKTMASLELPDNMRIEERLRAALRALRRS